MLTVSVVQHAEITHVYVTRWSGGSKYPQRLIDLDLATEPGRRGRETLVLALQAVLSALDRADRGDSLSRDDD